MAYSAMDALSCRLPEMTSADGAIEVERFTVEADSLENLRLEMEGGRRQCVPGEYTRLLVDGRLWMSDTTAERSDHLEVVWAAAQQVPGSGTGYKYDPEVRHGRALVGGLGLGCVVGALLDFVEHVDVVEKDERVAEFIGGWYLEQFPGRVTIHVADAMEIRWPRGVEWDVVWHDIWPTLCTDDLEQHATLNRRYARRAGWYGCWGNRLLKRQRERERTMPWFR